MKMIIYSLEMKHNMTHEERTDLYHWYNEAKDGKLFNCIIPLLVKLLNFILEAKNEMFQTLERDKGDFATIA